MNLEDQAVADAEKQRYDDLQRGMAEAIDEKEAADLKALQDRAQELASGYAKEREKAAKAAEADIAKAVKQAEKDAEQAAEDADPDKPKPTANERKVKADKSDKNA